jgi:outer membrane protein, heavy metal efflux system
MDIVNDVRPQLGSRAGCRPCGCKVLLFVCGLSWVAVGIPGWAQDAALFPENELLTPEHLVTAVLRRNPSLEAQRAAMNEAAARIKTAGALDDPMLSVMVPPATIGKAVGTREDVQVSQALPWWGTRAARGAAARAMADAASEDVQSLALRLRAVSESAFADWRYIHAALEVNRHHQMLYTELREAAKARFAAGLASQQDVLQADVQRTMLRQEGLELTQRQLTIQAGINALLDRPADAAIPSPGPIPPGNTLPALAALESFALEQHPDVRQLQFQERLASEQMSVAEKARYPSVVLTAGYNSMWDDPEMRATVGISINVPLDQGKRRSEIDAARANAHRAEASLADLGAHLRGDLAAAYAAVEESRQSLALYRDQLVPLADSTLSVARSEYAAGQNNFLYVINAEHDWFDAELGLARTETELFKRLAELGRLAGTSLPLEIPRPGRTFDTEETAHE